MHSIICTIHTLICTIAQKFPRAGPAKKIRFGKVRERVGKRPFGVFFCGNHKGRESAEKCGSPAKNRNMSRPVLILGTFRSRTFLRDVTTHYDLKTHNRLHVI
jgi:hypothetical protein